MHKFSRHLMVFIASIVFGVAHAQVDIPYLISVAWNNNGHLAMGYSTGLLKIVELSSNTVIQERIFDGQVMTLDWNPINISELAVGVWQWNVEQPNSSVYIYEPGANAITDTYYAGTAVSKVRWHPNGDSVIANSDAAANLLDQGMLRIYGRKPNIPFYTEIRGPEYRIGINDFDWSPDGTQIVSAFGDDVVVWNAIDGSEIYRLTGHTDWVYAVAWSPDGSRIASTSQDGTLRVWGPVTQQQLTQISLEGFVAGQLIWFDSNSLLAMAALVVEIWDINTGTKVSQIAPSGNIRDFVLVNNDTQFAIANASIPNAIGAQIEDIPIISNPICTTTIAIGNTVALISAISDANANATADTICLADGTYTLTASNVIDYGDNGLPLITSDLTLVGLGDNVVIERGAGAPAFRLLHVKDTGTLTLENLTLSNGNAGITHGGAVYARGALTLRDVTITGNFARRGGGVRMNGAPLTVTGSTFQNNSADREGGAIYVSGINSPVDVSSSQFTANSATNSGGGFYLSGTTTSLVANDVVFTGNQANGGGAIYAVPSTLNITNATFTSNEALVSSGGAIYTTSDSSVAVANSTFTTNEAGSDGGALRAGNNLTLTGSTLTSNVSEVGAAVFSQNAATITGNRIELNAASELGGGLYVSHNGNTHSITGNCISGNTAPQFSGLLGVTSSTNATGNWWGATDGPVSGNTVSANVIFTPFLSACPLD